jgi:hypothetical protein
MVLCPVTVAVPAGFQVAWPAQHVEHEWRAVEVDTDGYEASGLPARTMGRSIAEDEAFFASALAGGVLLGELMR